MGGGVGVGEVEGTGSGDGGVAADGCPDRVGEAVARLDADGNVGVGVAAERKTERAGIKARR